MKVTIQANGDASPTYILEATPRDMMTIRMAFYDAIRHLEDLCSRTPSINQVGPDRLRDWQQQYRDLETLLRKVEAR